MTINRIGLEEAIRRLGKAHVFVGDAFTADGLDPLGMTQGEIEVEEQESYEDLQSEDTGEGVLARRVVQEGALVTVPIIVGPKVDGNGNGADIYDKISSVGDGSGGGYSTPQEVVTTNLVLVPVDEIDPDSGLSYDGTDWTPNPPVHAVWLWKAAPEVSSQTFRRDDGGRVIRNVPFRTLFDPSKPEGHKYWTRGDPTEHDIEVEI